MDRSIIMSIDTGMLTLPVQANNCFATISTTNGFNTQCNDIIQHLGELTRRYNAKVLAELANNPDFRGARQSGVKLAWKYEKASVEMGGKGTANWNKEQRQQIMDKGSVKGAEGHHQQNVADHPESQADPNNIKFYKSKQEHLLKGHQGDFKNESDAPMIDKEQRLRQDNRNRVMKNEIKGAGIAALIAFATSASISAIISLAQNGISPESIKQSAKAGLRAGMEASTVALLSYGASRALGQLIQQAITGQLENWGIEITEKLATSINTGVIGSITIIISSVYLYVKLRLNGTSRNAALKAVGRQAVVSVAILAVTIVVQSAYGGPAGVAVGIGISAIMLSYSMYGIFHDKKLMDRIHTYTIEKSRPFQFV